MNAELNQEYEPQEPEFFKQNLTKEQLETIDLENDLKARITSIVENGGGMNEESMVDQLNELMKKRGSDEYYESARDVAEGKPTKN